MNREIKFRIWSKSLRIIISDLSLENLGDELDTLNNLFLNDNVIYQQYVGQKDKNGKEIYEGDIVKVKRCFTNPCVKNGKLDYVFTEGEEEVGEVLYLWASHQFAISYKRYDDFDDIMPDHRMEVIGNVYEDGVQCEGFDESR